jgi:FkbM family methyltransferase
MLRRVEEYLRWVSGRGLDLFHATAPFHYDRPVLVDFDICPMVASFYDLIPLIYPAQYLSGWWEEQYLRTLAFLGRSARMIAISESARTDAARYLGFPVHRIDVAWPIPDDSFRVMAPTDVAAALADLRRRVPLPESYVLTVSHLHHTKNLTTLLRAYSLLPAPLRAALPLVVCCHLDRHGIAFLEERAGRLGVAGDIVLTDLVTDEELTALYNGATVVVHPSRYEGFGLPVVEAMRCGAPVVTTTASSLPEAAGDAALLVDPDDAHGFALAIQELHEDREKRQAMGERGLLQAARFDKAQLATRTLECYGAAVAGEPATDLRPRIAVLTPVPPDTSPVADYSLHLLGALGRRYDVEVFVEDGCMPTAAVLARHRVAHTTALDRRHALAPFDAFLYQLAGPAVPAGTLAALGAHPGIAVVHDGLGDLRTVDQVVHRSVAQIVHREGAAGVLRAASRPAAVHTIPVGVADPLRHPSRRRQAVRSGFGATSTTFVVGVFLIDGAPRSLEEWVDAVTAMAVSHPDSLLVVVGQPPDEQSLSIVDQHAPIVIVGGGSSSDLEQYVLACDVILLPQSPLSTRALTLLMQAMAAGRPVVTSELPHWPGMPDDLVTLIPMNRYRAPAIAAELTRLASDVALRERIAAEGRCFYEVAGTVDGMADAYAGVLNMCGASVRRPAHGAVERPRGALAAVSVATSRNSEPVVKPFRFNKVCEIEDFSRPELLEIIRDVCAYKLPNLPAGFPVGSEHRKDWEVAMAVRTLRHFGALHRDATILGVAAGAEDTSFFLTREAKQVFATDRYLASGDWEPTAPLSMLIQPQDVAPYPFDADRLVVQHMDGRSLRYPDDTFDGIYSSGSIEHFGDLDDVASAAYEMGRVLKPGGVLTLSTEIRLAGPPGGIGWPGLTLLFSAENLQRFIVEASGLELVDELDTDVSDETLSVRRDLTQSILQHLAATKEGDQRTEYQAWEFPHIILLHEGYVFTSVHLALRKPADYPWVPNAWARPSEATLAAIAEHNRGLIAKTVTRTGPEGAPVVAGAPSASAASGPVSDHDRLAAMGRHGSTIRDDCAEIDQRTEDLDRLLVEVDRHLADMAPHPGAARAGRDLAGRFEAELATWAAQLDSGASSAAGAPAAEGDDGPALHWRSSRVAIPGGPEFDVVVDPRVGDQVTFALSVGVSLDQGLVKLMTDVISPGERVLDIGAHVGTFSLAAAAVGAQALAIEASPENAGLLRASAARNGFSNLTVVEAVASDAPGEVRFHAHGPWGQVSLGDDDRPEMAQATATAALSIADLLDALSFRPLAFVKMDVEGWELQVLKGMRGVLEGPQAPPLLYECNGHTLFPYGATPEDLVEAVAALGYASFIVDQDGLVPVDPADFQPQTLVDYLAVKRTPTLAAWPVRAPLGLDERVARIVADGAHPNHNHRVYMARALARSGPTILGHPSVQALVADLRRDPVPEVREAIASWSTDVAAGVGPGDGTR